MSARMMEIRLQRKIIDKIDMRLPIARGVERKQLLKQREQATKKLMEV